MVKLNNSMVPLKPFVIGRVPKLGSKILIPIGGKQITKNSIRILRNSLKAKQSQKNKYPHRNGWEAKKDITVLNKKLHLIFHIYLKFHNLSIISAIKQSNLIIHSCYIIVLQIINKYINRLIRFHLQLFGQQYHGFSKLFCFCVRAFD